ncbi:phosphopantetheine-binding protein [Pseudomonas putida]|uniref:phosphopantetheine-binding protein n=1 Tax=Pseudomonas putida TaxID=303 RepID=UPI003D974544
MSVLLSSELEVEHQVIKTLSKYFPPSHPRIELNSRLVEDLYADSISLVEIVMELNEVFGLELPEAGIEEWKTVSDICESIKVGKSIKNLRAE